MLIDKLNDLASEIHGRHPMIDHGGCCVVAAHMAKYLAKFTEVKVVCGDDACRNLNQIRKRMQNPLDKQEWEDFGINFSHVLVEFRYQGKWYAFDCTNGALPKARHWQVNGWDRCHGHWTIEEATSMANTSYGWNSMFDRSRIPAVRRKIGQFFLRNKRLLWA